MFPIIKKITPLNKYIGREGNKIDFIVIHYFGALASAEDLATYWYNNAIEASAHYLVDESSIYQSVKDEDTAWHCNEGLTGTYRLACHNENSIGIEMRPLKQNQNSLLVGDPDWYFDPQTIANTIELIQMLMVRYNLPIGRVIRHYDVSNKSCPRPFVGEDINTYYNQSGNSMWENFKEKIGEDEMDQTAFDKMLDIALRNKSLLKPNTYSADSRTWAENTAIIAKDVNMRYQSYVTREEMVTFLNRIYNLISNKSLETWKTQQGTEAIDAIAAIGITSNPEDWKKTLNQPVEQWLFWSIIQRAYEMGKKSK